jgi:dienelactone hydrolase
MYVKRMNVEYTDGKTKFVGQLVWDERQSGKRPGIVVFPEAFGLNDHARQRAERLAQLGYVALAADPHGEGAVFDDLATVMPKLQILYADRATWRARARAALDALVKQPQVDESKTAAIGFCFGGTTCFELGRTGAQLSAIATFHAGLLAELPEDAGRMRAKVLVCHGADDPLVQGEAVNAVMGELRRDKVDWQFNYFGNAVHSFTDPEADKRNVPGVAYNKQAEERSWAAMCHFFGEAFK